MEDFLAHSSAWYSQTTYTLAEARGILISELLTNSNLLFLNLNSPTHLLSRGDLAFPDLTITSSYIGLDSEWRTLTTLNSDHFPIILQLGSYFQMNLLIAPTLTLKRGTGTRTLVKWRYLLLY